jgi:hypothetical protein
MQSYPDADFVAGREPSSGPTIRVRLAVVRFRPYVRPPPRNSLPRVEVSSRPFFLPQLLIYTRLYLDGQQPVIAL